MPKYLITVPLCGSISCEVETEEELINKDQAYDALLNAWNKASGDIRLTRKARDEGFELGEIEFLEQVTQGNVCYAPMMEMEFEQVEGDD